MKTVALVFFAMAAVLPFPETVPTTYVPKPHTFTVRNKR